MARQHVIEQTDAEKWSFLGDMQNVAWKLFFQLFLYYSVIVKYCHTVDVFNVVEKTVGRADPH